MGDSIKDRLTNSGRLRFGVSHSTILAYSAILLIIVIAFTIRVLPLRWENLSGGTALLNEFDPYYQFSITQHMVNNGLVSPYYPTHWINMQKWYPDGLDMSNSLPGLPMTAAAVYQVISLFGADIDLMTFCSIFPAIAAVIACLILYLVGKDMGGRTVGLFAALFLALAPSFLQRSSLGFFDTEIPGVIGLVLFVFLFLRSMDSNRSLRASILYSLGAGLSLAYFISGWGAAYYVIGLSTLFVFVLVLLKRYSPRMLISYSITYGLALFIGTKVPYISLNYLTSAAILPVAAVFIVLLVSELLRNNITSKTKLYLTVGTIVVIVGAFIVFALTGTLSSLTGKFITVLDPFIRSASPLVDSVAEQRISAWGNLYIEFGISIIFFLTGLYFTIRNPTNRNIFLLLFALTGVYFAGSMVRLLVLLTPAFAIIAGIGIVTILKPFNTLLHEVPQAIAKSKRKMPRVSKEYSGVVVFIVFLLLMSNLAFSPQTGGMPRSISGAYVPTAISSSSIPVGGPGLGAPVRAWLDAIDWMHTNVASSTVIDMWWDYGNWLADLGNVTSLADNTTVNSTQIENIGYTFMANENQTLTMLSTYGQNRVQYIGVFTVLVAQQTSTGWVVSQDTPYQYGDDGKWTWMASISGQAKQRFIDTGFLTSATAWTDQNDFGSYQNNQWVWNDKGLNCTVKELLNYALVQYCDVMTSLESYGTVSPDLTTTIPTYLQPAEFAGLEIPPGTYGGFIPIVAIYSIDWAAWNADHPTS